MSDLETAFGLAGGPDAIRTNSEPRTYSIGGGWGSSCSFFPRWKVGSAVQKVTGHKTRPPVVGDILIAEMQSRRFLKMVFIAVENCHDPSDQFFGTVVAVGEHVEQESPDTVGRLT